MTYEGWTNYVSWAVKLWLDNEEWSYREVTAHALDDPDAQPCEFADWLKDFTDASVIGESRPDSGLASDLFGAAWSDVDWQEIAEAYLADAKEETAREVTP